MMHIKDRREELIALFTACLDECIAQEEAMGGDEIQVSLFKGALLFEGQRGRIPIKIVSQPEMELDNGLALPILPKAIPVEPPQPRTEVEMGRPVQDIREVCTNLWRVRRGQGNRTKP